MCGILFGQNVSGLTSHRLWASVGSRTSNLFLTLYCEAVKCGERLEGLSLITV